MANLSGRSYPPFRIPAGWKEQERSLVRQIQDVLDSLFRGNRTVKAGTKEARSILNMIYPVGSVYISMDSTAAPGDLFGGTWESVTSTVGYAWQRTE